MLIYKVLFNLLNKSLVTPEKSSEKGRYWTFQLLRYRRESPGFHRFLQISLFVTFFYWHYLPSPLRESLIRKLFDPFPNVYFCYIKLFALLQLLRKHHRIRNIEWNIIASGPGITLIV